MALLTHHRLPLASLATHQGLPVAHLASLCGLRPLPSGGGGTTPATPGTIPAPDRYWSFDGTLYDLVDDWYLGPSQGGIEYVADGAVYGQAARSLVTGTAWIGLAYADYGSPSRAVVAAWLKNGAFNLGGLIGSEQAGVRTLVVEESSELESPISLFALRIGSEDGLTSGQADEIAIWLDPPAEWTAAAAAAALSQGDGVVWRAGQWWEVAE